MTIQQYIDKINTLYKTGDAREHSYRGDLANLLMTILPEILVTNEPARVACGAPDYVLTKKDIPVGYIEAKDIGVDLASKSLKEQFDRYKAGLTNLMFTDYLDFHFYKEGDFVAKISIAKIEDGNIIGLPENFEQFTSLIQNFAQTISQTIKSPTKLAQMMAGKAKLMANIIEKSLNYDDENDTRSQLKSQMLSFQQMLIHDIDNKAFADIYAQTIAYGMFAARYHDPTLPTFSRQEAAELIPKSNPFLRKLFQDIAGYDLDTRLVWIVEELVSIFLASDVANIMKNFGKSTKQEDPVVHFYETFLGEYNPALRKARGVWYTPQPVVNFIVRAVDDILKTEFHLKAGLADTSKIKIKKKAVTQTKGKDAKLKEVETEVEVHKVQILDPATGTGTFLAETIRHIYKKFEGQQGIWSNYITNDLIPRLNGFELLMASYAMAHLKMDMLLTETGYKPTDNQRFRIFLTNSLEEAHPDTQTLFSSWLSDEADQANAIKRDAPVMVVMGNPPYSGESSNKGEWIMNLMEDYKKEPGGIEKLKEKNSKWINDDYVKFMRFGQHFIDKNGSGILAFINPHGFLDNPTFRGMRWNLLQSFDKIYTIDLHGNSKKKEITPDGSIDQNVFDIMQGVSINFLVKTGNKKEKELAKVFHYDLFGKRDLKYDFLLKNDIKTTNYKLLEVSEPNFYFKEKNSEIENIYMNFFNLKELFIKSTIGVQSHRDELVVDFNENILKSRFNTIFNSSDLLPLINKHNIKQSNNWNLQNSINKTKSFKEEEVKKLCYRPFDERFIYYNDNFVDRTRQTVGKEIKNNNLVLNFPKIVKVNWNHSFITKSIPTAISMDINGTYFAPLYLYPEINEQQSLIDEVVRTPNLNMEIVSEIAKGLGLQFVSEKEEGNVCMANNSEVRDEFRTTFAPIDILDYIYAVLHSPTYREKYKEFLKIDFPRVPYPKDAKTFFDLVAFGSQLRAIHLLESDVTENYLTKYPMDGDNVVGKPRFENSPPLEGCPSGGVVADAIINSIPIYYNPIIDLPYNIKLKPRAKELRQAENLSEVLFWMQVTKGQFHKIDFDRQRIIGNYIVDFYIKKLGLIIEIDGSSHDNKEKYDAERDAYFESFGLKVYHIPVVEVLQEMKLVIRKLEDYIVDNYNVATSLSGNSSHKQPPRLSGTPPEEGNLGKVYINATQYFENVPEVAWNFYIGGYQPAQKWLKDRKDRTLSYEDIFHYQKIIVALTETDRIMKELDAIAI